MANIIPFDTNGKNLPAYLKSFSSEVTNALAAHHSITFPVISIKGKVWTIKRGGEKFIIPNPKDPESPATYVDVVIIKANPKKSKVWYANGWQDGVENGKPDCSSRDSEKPDADCEAPQSKLCATCKHNQWGSKINEKGVATKGKACQDTIRLAISTPDRLNDPHLVRVPPASIKAAGEYGEMLQKRGVPLESVVTRLSFDPEEATPKIMFKAIGFLDEKEFAEAHEIADSELVESILGTAYVPDADDGEGEPEAAAAAAKAVRTAKSTSKVEISKDKTVTADEVKAAIKAGEAGETVAEAKVVQATPEPVPAAVSVESIDVDGIPDLSKISFDD
ncbi:hypothetical protein [Paraburkholderia sp. BL10I2N1]|uniref:hypothetical protein n=1 Tax=Paraburkholderia sp. BL10I2N1 TaxID=1938796 RepID=UPI00105FC663|nr:hypothetical protein [Paraburkholderia sp. BL10I2N1]TDN70484.1 hypothetical protein B0G77_3958 [Paraburkholderia sp. BL10I2N1]